MQLWVKPGKILRAIIDHTVLSQRAGNSWFPFRLTDKLLNWLSLWRDKKQVVSRALFDPICSCLKGVSSLTRIIALLGLDVNRAPANFQNWPSIFNQHSRSLISVVVWNFWGLLIAEKHWTWTADLQQRMSTQWAPTHIHCRSLTVGPVIRLAWNVSALHICHV